MFDLTVYLEKAVRHFPRYHKYTLGSELRSMCHDGLGLIAEANSLAPMERRAVLLRLRLVLEHIHDTSHACQGGSGIQQNKIFFSCNRTDC